MTQHEMPEIVGLIRSVGDVDDMQSLERSYANAVELAGGVDGFGVFLFDEQGDKCELLFSGGDFPCAENGSAASLCPGAEDSLAQGRAFWPDDVKAGSRACLPLLHGGTVFGFASLLMTGETDALSRTLHELIADELARMLVAIELRENLSERLSDTEARLRGLIELGLRLNTLKLEFVAARFTGAVLRAVGAQVGALLLRVDDDWAETYEHGLRISDALAVKTPEGAIGAVECVKTRRPVTVDGYNNEGNFAFIPLAGPSETVGVCCLARGMHEPSFTENELELPVSMASLAATSIANARFHAESIERERWKAAVAVAYEIQQGLMPAESLQTKGLEAAFHWESSEVVGGDYLDLIPQEDGGLRVVVGDVTGHGVGPALLMTSTRAALRMLGRDKEFNSKLVDQLNRFLISDVLPMGIFVTLFITEIDPVTGAMRYVNAGHNPALIIGADNKVRSRLAATGFPLGIEEDVEYEYEDEVLGPGEKLVVYTDGLIEARSLSGEQLGMERFEELVSAPRNSAAEVVENLKTELNKYCGSQPPLDDQTIVIIKQTCDV